MKTRKMIISIALSILILIISQISAQVIASVFLVIKVPEFICNMLNGILYILFAFSLIKLLCTKYIKEDMSNYKIPEFKIEVEWIIIAFALPLLVTAFYLLFVKGSFVSNQLDISAKLGLITAGIFSTGLGAGIVEEMVFRGVMMGVIEKQFNKKIAIIVPSLLFGFVHILGMNYDLLSSALVVFTGTVVGIMFSLIASETKSIWNSAIVHAVWNMVIIGGFLGIGTKFDEYSLYSYVMETEVFALTGGEFGIEASVIAAAGYCLVCVFVLITNRRKRKRFH